MSDEDATVEHVPTKPGRELTLHDRLSQLDFLGACKLLGPGGAALIRRGGQLEPDALAPIPVSATRAVIRIERAEVALWLADDRPRRLRWQCSRCRSACEHAGAAFSAVLEDKVALGLAEPPVEDTATSGGLVERAVAERAERARSEKMVVRSADPAVPWTDYVVTSAESGRTYRVALRSDQRGDSYCSCPDFRKNTLGTCKHVLHVLHKARRRFPAAALKRPYARKEISVHLRYGADVELRVAVPGRCPSDVRELLAPVLDRGVVDVRDLVRRIGRLERLGCSI